MILVRAFPIFLLAAVTMVACDEHRTSDADSPAAATALATARASSRSSAATARAAHAPSPSSTSVEPEHDKRLHGGWTLDVEVNDEAVRDAGTFLDCRAHVEGSDLVVSYFEPETPWRPRQPALALELEQLVLAIDWYALHVATDDYSGGGYLFRVSVRAGDVELATRVGRYPRLARIVEIMRTLCVSGPAAAVP